LLIWPAAEEPSGPNLLRAPTKEVRSPAEGLVGS